MREWNKANVVLRDLTKIEGFVPEVEKALEGKRILKEED